MDIQSSLPYELRTDKTTTKLLVTLPNGELYTYTLPFLQSPMTTMTIDYDATKGLQIYATGVGEQTYFETVSPEALSGTH